MQVRPVWCCDWLVLLAAGTHSNNSILDFTVSRTNITPYKQCKSDNIVRLIERTNMARRYLSPILPVHVPMKHLRVQLLN